jgi:hypothetical protein
VESIFIANLHAQSVIALAMAMYSLVQTLPCVARRAFRHRPRLE